MNDEQTPVEQTIGNGTRQLAGDAPVCSVHTKKAALDGELEDEQITAREYATLQQGYDFINATFYDGSLPQPLITFQRHPRARGYVSVNKFQRRGNPQAHVHELALNPDSFNGRTDEEILSTMCHESGHVWQHEYGNPGRGGYHNREWARKMHSIGLMPSSTGKPGGATTGDHMSHYIMEDGPFARACRTFLTKYRLTWETADDNNSGTVKRRQTRAKLTCPICGKSSLAAPGARFGCEECWRKTGEFILLLPSGAGQTGTDEARISDTLSDNEYDRAIRFLANALWTAGKDDISLEQFLPALSDFTAAVERGVHEENSLAAFIAGMDVDDMRAGASRVKNSRHDASRVIPIRAEGSSDARREIPEGGL